MKYFFHLNPWIKVISNYICSSRSHWSSPTLSSLLGLVDCFSDLWPALCCSETRGAAVSVALWEKCPPKHPACGFLIPLNQPGQEGETLFKPVREQCHTGECNPSRYQLLKGVLWNPFLLFTFRWGSSSYRSVTSCSPSSWTSVLVSR